MLLAVGRCNGGRVHVCACCNHPIWHIALQSGKHSLASECWCACVKMPVYYGAAVACAFMPGDISCVNLLNVHPRYVAQNTSWYEGYGVIYTDERFTQPGVCRFDAATSVELTNLDAHLGRYQHDRSANLWMMDSQWGFDTGTCDKSLHDFMSIVGVYMLTNWNLALVRRTDECDPTTSAAGVLIVSSVATECSEAIVQMNATIPIAVADKNRIRKAIEQYIDHTASSRARNTVFTAYNLMYAFAGMPAIAVALYFVRQDRA